ncbi:MAG: hypothetical protein KF830_15560 [Planctomycetes bacterium]|nr:hypothetical protein [Planctomycetota bacterium]
MNTTTLATALAAALALTPLALAQHNPPPWWRVNDDVTVSLAWDFDNAATFLQPVLQVVPGWYNAAVTGFTVPPNAAWLPTLAGHSGVLGLVGTGGLTQALVRLQVDNDPHLDWIKIFWFQFDAFEGPTGEIGAEIEQDLVKYGRASVQQKTEPLGGGWNRVTIQARLIPQPDDEKLLFTMIENAFGSVGIDNLFVNSKCIKPGDEKGKAMGDVEGFAVDLLAATGLANCRAAAVTEGPAPGFARTYWITANATIPGPFHQVFRLNQAGTAIGATPLPVTLAQAPLGLQDLAVERVPSTGQQIVYALVDARPSGGNVELQALDSSGAPLPTANVVLSGFPPLPPQQYGLAFEPSGNLGAGTFWVSDPTGVAFEFDRAGNLLDQKPIPPGVVGLGYDAACGYFYGFSQAPRPTPAFGPSQTNGFEWSGYDFQPTGVEFCGDLRIPNPGGPAGGIAAGFEVYRRANGDLRMVAVVRLPSTNRSMLYELAGPFRFGWSQLGQCGMRGGPAFEGSPTFQITLGGVPSALLAVLYAGFSNDLYGGVPLPIPLVSAGMPESYISIATDVMLAAVPPSAPGEFAHAVNLPAAGGLSYVPLFFQWLVLDPTIPGALATSQAGKTIAY